MANLIKLELILTDKHTGDGTENNPYRNNLQLFTTDGTLVYEYDSHKDEVFMTANLIEVVQNLKIESMKNNRYEEI